MSIRPQTKLMIAGVLVAASLTGCTQAEQENVADTTERGLNEAGRVATNAVDKTTRVISDVSITGTIKAKILATKSLTGTTIDVTTRKGKVTLTGTVKNAAQKSAASRLAQDSPGVNAVINQLQIQK